MRNLSPEDAAEVARFREELQETIAAVDRGEVFKLATEEDVRRFFDEIDAEVRAIRARREKSE
jgi:hypothetical protein